MDERLRVPIEILHDFAGRIDGLDIPYMLSGSTAMIYYSVYRFTADIDIVIELQDDKAERLIKTLEPDYYVPHQAVRRAISSNRMFNIIHMGTAYKVDCIIKKKSDFQITAFERRRKADFYGKEIWIITLEDLIISKLFWAKDSKSDMQFKDIRNLIRGDYDGNYVNKWLDILDLQETFELSKEVSRDE